MTVFQTIDMAEVTRLTREGRLAEATALLQGRRPETGICDFASADTIDFMPPARDGAWRMPDGARPAVPLRTETAGKTAASGFASKTFTNAAGSRAYKLFVPSRYDGRPLPLVIMLHGCTQSPDDFAAGTRMNELAEARGLFVAYPAQSQSANSSRCWNWFNAADQTRDRGEPSLIAGITRQIMNDVHVDPRRVFIAGLSAGGAAAATMALLYPDLYAAVCVHSGLACGAAKDMMSAFGAMQSGGAGLSSNRTGPRVPTIVFHGDRDTTVNAVNGDHIVAQAKGAGSFETEVVRGRDPSGASYTRTIQTDRDDAPTIEHWVLHGAGHAWSGGSAAGSFTEPRGVDASREMLRFFGEHAKP